MRCILMADDPKRHAAVLCSHQAQQQAASAGRPARVLRPRAWLALRLDCCRHDPVLHCTRPRGRAPNSMPSREGSCHAVRSSPPPPGCVCSAARLCVAHLTGYCAHRPQSVSGCRRAAVLAPVRACGACACVRWVGAWVAPPVWSVRTGWARDSPSRDTFVLE